MKILDAFHRHAATKDDDSAESAVEGSFPIPRYDRLDVKTISQKLSGLSQEQLVIVEDYEHAHEDRSPVLAKLRYLRESEPFEGYDQLPSPGVKEALGSADPKMIRSVRDYERKLAHRPEILAETARLLLLTKAPAGAPVDDQ